MPRSSRRFQAQLLRAVARPPLRPAAFFCAVVPPCFEELLELLPPPDFLPPRLEAPGEFAIFAARSFDMPFSFSFSYCFSFLTFAFFPGICSLLANRPRERRRPMADPRPPPGRAQATPVLRPRPGRPREG